MELSAETIEHLRDEAYATLCGRALTEALTTLERKKAHIESTRPPFALLSTRQTREALTHSLAAVHTDESALRLQLAEVTQAEQCLHRLLRPALHTYLAGLDPGYGIFSHIRRALDDWQVAYQPLPDLIVAFARDARAARQACGSATPEQRDRAPLLVLRDSALRLERQLDTLDTVASRLAAFLPAGAEAEIRLPAILPSRHSAWVGVLLALPADRFAAEINQAETAARQFVAHDQSAIAARLDASREACNRYEQGYLENYWDQLRTHAQTYYVEEHPIADIIAMLLQNYVTSDLARRLRELHTADPFLNER
jgi:hypothetical protein